jgi:hypothetical protein
VATEEVEGFLPPFSVPISPSVLIDDNDDDNPKGQQEFKRSRSKINDQADEFKRLYIMFVLYWAVP